MTMNAIPVEPDQEWTIHRFRPEDAVGVTDLFRSVYGDKYPVRTYLEPELLAKENREGRVISSVARIPSGAVVGHNALFNSAPNPRIFESGSGVVHKFYRGGQGIFTQMAAHGIEMGKENPGVDLIYGEPVCNHPFTQQLCYRLNFPTRAMEVSLMPAAAYAKEQSAKGRVSTLLGFFTLKPRPCKVFVPKGLEDQFSRCYEGLDDTRTFEAAKEAPGSPESRIHTQTFEFAQVARVAVHDTGTDFQTRITAEEERLISQGIRVIQVWLNTGRPWVGQAVNHLAAMGYFFGGVLPQWFGTDGMLMQKVLDEPDWEGTVLVGEWNKQVAGLVRREWEKR
ncbi:hypothetical protein [Desulfobacter vibrioformis]|uniref:hypothetical protein n=1 Tax=Desulfobacter vibrioformis TaxID=34031 RepID=UPI000690A517|nr:hypothetical protein [Desulfobacter vibrioformis]